MELRKRLGIPEHGPLLADQLAEELGVTVWSVDQVAGMSSTSLQVLEDQQDDSWLALTMRIGPKHLVIHKTVSSEGHRNSIVMHELSHIILGHQLAEACMLEDGSLVPGNFDQDQEYEADWLAGTLLLPRPSVVSIRRRRLPNAVACQEYSVTQDMLNWRVKMTGVDRQFSRRRAC
ncbi:MAG: ImmA/IrrE family metallo-endopeptidase [Pseudomonadota bacterium]